MVLVVWRWEGEFISLVKRWRGSSAGYDGTCLWSNLSISWNLPLILAPVWQETLACLSLILTHAPVWKTCEILKKRHNKLQPNYCTMLCTWNGLYVKALVLPSTWLFDFFYYYYFLNALCVLHLGEDTKFCQLFQSIKATIFSPCKAKELTGKHPGSRKAGVSSVLGYRCALCCGAMSLCPSPLLVDQGCILWVGLYIIC